MHLDPEGIEELPDQMQSFLESVGWWMPDEGYPTDDIAMMFERNHKGLCLLCAHKLGPDTILIVDGNGVQNAFCGPPCMQDFPIMQQLMTWYDDMVQAVKFRHGGDVVQEEDDILDEEEEAKLTEILRDRGEGAERQAGGEDGEEEGEASEETQTSDPSSSREDEAEDADTSS